MGWGKGGGDREKRGGEQRSDNEGRTNKHVEGDAAEVAVEGGLRARERGGIVELSARVNGGK